MVGCNGYRNPALYAKIASTVDVASHGRLYAGIGAGWYEHEWKAYGYEWDDTPERMRKFREAVQIIHKMWTEDYPTFDGTYYSIDKPINEPKNSRQGQGPVVDRRRRRAGDAEAGRASTPTPAMSVAAIRRSSARSSRSSRGTARQSAATMPRS